MPVVRSNEDKMSDELNLDLVNPEPDERFPAKPPRQFRQDYLDQMARGTSTIYAAHQAAAEVEAADATLDPEAAGRLRAWTEESQ